MSRAAKRFSVRPTDSVTPHSRKISPIDHTDPERWSTSAGESFAYVGENSKVHFEMRTQGSARDQTTLEMLRLLLTFAIGLTLALIAAATVVVSGLLRMYREDAVMAAMACPSEHNAEQCANSATSRMVRGFGIYIGIGLGLVLTAAALTAWAPNAAGSGLPELKAFLNGCHTPKILQPSTLLAKAIGTTLVVTSSLPIGREGPMVHIGAALAICLSRLISSLRCGRLLFEMRSPAAQRNWVGVGAAAGVAAAFNSPLGGILYSFEEVCSHWSSRMTWLSFLCSVTIVAAVDLLNDVSGGFIAAETLVHGLDAPSKEYSFRASFMRGDFLWIVLLGAAGGLAGACYNLMAFRFARLRKRVLRWRTFSHRVKWVRVLEVAVVSIITFSIFFWVPALSPCTPCPADATGCGDLAAIDEGRRLAGSGSNSLHHRLHSLRYRQWVCPVGEYSELATLLQAGQEELIKHLLSREDTDAPTFSLSTYAVFLPLYFALAVVALGLAVPAGNFIPALTIGAALGRLEATLLLRGGFIRAEHVGHYALVGGAAALGGVTRMTMTIAVILAEVSDDVATLPACMLALAVARFVGNRLSSSFDHGMIEISRAPFLRESPPRIFEVLTAKDVMAPRPMRLLEVTTVRDVLHVLESSNHNGFPVVSGSCLTPGPPTRGTYLVGLVLRRQLLVLLKEKVWEGQTYGVPLAKAAKERFLTSFVVMEHVDLRQETYRVRKKLKTEDLDSPLDLRSFYDPAPFAVNCLAPLSVVYRLFNEIGCRHIPVLAADQTLLGIITRKDVQPETISQRLSAVEVHAWAHEMHEYWRNLLFGSTTSDSGDPSEAEKKRGSVNLSAPSRNGSVVSVAAPSRNGSVVSVSGRGSYRRRMSNIIMRRSTDDTAASEDGNRRASTGKRPSLSLLHVSTQAKLVRNSLDGAHPPGPIVPRMMSLRGDSLVRNSLSLAPAEADVQVPRDVSPSDASDGPSNGSKSASTGCVSRRSFTALIDADGMENANTHSPCVGSRSPKSDQPSLSASLCRASARRCRESRIQQGVPSPPPYLNGGSGSPKVTTPTRSNNSSGRGTPVGGMRASKHLWQFAIHSKQIHRRESAPAKLLSYHFQELKSVKELNASVERKG